MFFLYLKQSHTPNELILSSTYRGLKDIIAEYERNAITKYNLMEETKGFSEDGESFFSILSGNSFRFNRNQEPREGKFCIPVHICDRYGIS